jgi:hypothetical protein
VWHPLQALESGCVNFVFLNATLGVWQDEQAAR